MDTFERWFTQDLNKPILPQHGQGLVFTGDDGTPLVGVHVTRNGAPADLSGAVSCTVIRADGTTVPVTGGTISGGDVSVVLSSACFNIRGPIGVALAVTSGSTTMTVLKAVFQVDITSTGNIIDPSGEITLDVANLIADIDAAVASIPADYSDLLAAIAPTFSASTAYAAGAYVWYNGNLYRFTAAHAAGAWIGTDAAQVTLAGDVADLKNALNTLAIPVISQAIPWTQGWIRNDGTDGDATTLCKTVNMFALPANVRVTVKTGFEVQLVEYSTLGDTTSFVRKLNATFESGINVFATLADKYYRFMVQNSEGTRIYYYDLADDTVTWEGEPLYTDTSLSLSGKAADAKVTGDELTSINSRFKIVNLFDKDSPGCIADSYLNAENGQPASLAGHTVSDFIDISAFSSFVASGTHIICFYDDEKVFTGAPSSMDSRSTDLTISVPTGVKYLRFSTFNSYIPTAQIGKNVSRSEYIPFGKFTMPDLIVQTVPIVVDANGNGDYTSLTLALKEHVDEEAEIKVLPGTYDIVSEYNAIWGTEAVDGMADSSTDFNGFQFGIIIRNKKIEFMPGAVVVCEWHYKSDGTTARTVNGTHRFSPVRVDYNSEIIGLNMVCSYSFYAIHDDYGLTTEPYTVKYKDCVVNAEYLHQQNVIGGGCQKYSRHIIENCYFSNGEHSNIHTARYHNTNRAGAVPEIYVSNTYFNGTFTARWYGTQTTKMSVYVNNCKARAIYTMQEDERYTEENVDLFKWCNEETNPV